MRLIAFLIFVVPAVLGGLERLGAPDSRLADPVWEEYTPGSTVTVDHATWAGFLDRHLVTAPTGPARIAYGTVSPDDRKALSGYLRRLADIDPGTLDRPEQLAYWINFYNAATVVLVLDNYPVGSIRDIGSGLFEDGPWDRPVAVVSDRVLTLNTIEHGIIRPVFDEPRIHYALNCAAVGCPNLAARPYTGAALEAALAEAERAFVNDPRGVRLDGDKLVLSKIWLWFREDFAPTETQIIQYLRTVATGAAAEALDGRGSADRYDYDWSLNAAH